MKEMSFWMHIKDLKLAFLRVLMVFLVLLGCFYSCHSYILKILLHHLDGKQIGDIIFTNIIDGFVFRLDVSASLSILALLPYLMIEAYLFVRCALKDREIFILRCILLFCITLFTIGCSVAYFYILPNAIDFFIGFFTNGIILQLKAIEYIDFVLSLMIGFGVFMQAPVAIFLFDRFGVVDHSFFVKKRRFVIVAIFAIAAILTPPDVVSQIVLGLLMLILVEISFVFCKLFAKKK